MTTRRLVFAAGLLENLVEVCRRALPAQSFGVLAGPEAMRVESIDAFTRNLRPSDPDLGAFFGSYGEFYRRPDRGFVADPQEQLRVFRAIEARGFVPAAVYHSHRELAAVPTAVDVDFHYDRAIAAVIVSLAVPGCADVRAFEIGAGSWREIPVWDGERPSAGVVGLPAAAAPAPTNVEALAPVRSR